VFASMPGTDSSPSAQLGREDEAMRICLAIEQLSADDRNVILWRFFDQLGFGEIAERTGRREGTVRQSCLRAVEKLRTIMESAQ
jgi:RNA polymerase sigma factor (sigma-70 family)